jgi:hypothetical protein
VTQPKRREPSQIVWMDTRPLTLWVEDGPQRVCSSPRGIRSIEWLEGGYDKDVRE